MPSWVSEATEASFQTEVLERSHAALVMVDFWAEWCGPCRTLTPTLESVVEGRGGSVQLVKVNVDQCPEPERPVRHSWHSSCQSIPQRPAGRRIRGGTRTSRD
jgi:thiol-disulfide isomerase/thioredoxin